MRGLIVGLIVVLNIILESTVFQYTRVFGVKPDFIIILIVAYSILQGRYYGILIGFFSGILVDFMYGQIIGINALAYMLTGLLINQVHESVFKDSYFPAILFNIIAVFVYQHIFFVVSYFTKLEISYTNALVNIIIPQSLFNAVLGGIIYRYIYKLDNKRVMERRFL